MLENQAARPLEGGRSSADEILCRLMKTGESVSPELFSSFQKAKQSMQGPAMEYQSLFLRGGHVLQDWGFFFFFFFFLSFWSNPKIPLVAQMLKNLPANAGDTGSIPS